MSMAIAGPAVASNPSDPGINAYYDELTRARATDFRQLVNSFHPQGLFIFLTGPQGPGPVVTADQLPDRTRTMADQMKKAGMKLSTGYRIEKRSVVGDVAVDTGYMRTTQTMNGKSRSHYARFLVTLKRDGERWRVLSDAAWVSDEATYNAVRKTDGLKYDA